MASPYFSNIQVNRGDYSGLQRGAEAQARAMAQNGAIIGGMLKNIGSAYFEKKEAEALADDFMQTEEFRNMAKSKNMSDEEINAIQMSPEYRAKEGQKFLKDAGGVQEAMKKYREGIKFKQEFEVNEARKNQIQQQTNLIQNQNKQIELQTNLSNAKNAYLTWSSDPKNKDVTPVTRSQEYLKYVKEQGGDVSLATRSVQEVNKAMGLGRYNSALLPTIKQGMMKTEGDGTQLEELNFLSQSEMQNAVDSVITNLNLPQEQIDALTKQLESLVVPDGGVRKTAEGIAELVGFGEFKQVMDSMGDLRQTDLLINNALAYVMKNPNDPEGLKEYFVGNPVSASVALIKLAKLAQGAGVLSNQDVNRIQGSQTFYENVNRWYDKKIGSEYKVTSKDIGEGGQFHKLINPATSKPYEAGEIVQYGGGEITANDLLFMKDVMGALQGKFMSDTNKYVPRIFKGVQDQYGGLTLGEIDTQLGGISEFVQGGIESLYKNQAVPMETDVAHARNAIKKGMSREEFLSQLGDLTPEQSQRVNSAFGIANEQLLESSDQTLSQYEANEASAGEMMQGFTGNEKPLNEKELRKTATQSYNELVDNVMKDIDNNVSQRAENAENGRITMGVVAGASAGTSATGYFSNKAENSLNQNRIIRENITGKDGIRFDSMDSGMTSKQKYNQMLSEKLDNPKELAKQAKLVGIDPNDTKKFGFGKKGEAKLKKAVTKKLDQQVADKATKVLGKSFIKKAGLSLVGGLVSGGIGWAIGTIDMLSDVGEIRDQEYDAKIDELKSMQSTLSGKELELNKALVAKLNYQKNNFLETANEATSYEKRYNFGR